MTVSVVEGVTGAPVSDAAVTLTGRVRRQGTTDTNGEVTFRRMEAGEYDLQVRHLGYAPATARVLVRMGAPAGAIVILEVVVPTLDTVRSTNRILPPGVPLGFAQRQRLGLGRFLTAVDLAPEGDRAIGSVLTTRLPGVFVADVGGASCVYSARGGSRNTGSMGAASPGCAAGCPIRVLLDDADVSGELWRVKTWDIAAVEYYPAGFVPVQYRDARATCGILLLWSKR